MFITEVIPIDKKKRKVCLESGYTFPLYLSEIRRYRISEGQEISEKDLGEIQKILISRVKNRILFLIGDSDKSTSSIRNKIMRAGYPDEVVEEAIDWLTEKGYLNDERFARNYIESMKEYRGKSRREIILGLYTKGIDKDIIERTISEFEFDEYELIMRSIKKKNIDIENIAYLDMKSRSNLYQYLMRKGFSSDSINKFFSGNF